MRTVLWMYAFFVGLTGISDSTANSDNVGLLRSPAGPVVLAIAGDIELTNVGDEARFDLEMIEELGLEELRTATPWTDGTQLFEGVPLERILDLVGAAGTTIRAQALNDYVVNIDLPFATDARALVALRMNGDYMSVREKGPLWIVFPWDQEPELDGEYVKAQSIWQLNRLEIR